MRNILLFVFVAFSTACYAQSGMWTWIGGDSTVDETGWYQSYGSPYNKIPARMRSTSWIDNNGSLWMFGGGRYVPGSSFEYFNDLWKYTPGNNFWSWVSGNSYSNAYGVSGTQGVASPANKPASREWSAGWADTVGNLWLFGGEV